MYSSIVAALAITLSVQAAAGAQSVVGLQGRVVAVGGAAGALRVVVGGDTIAADPEGRFAIQSPAGASVRLWVGGDSSHHPAVVRLRADGSAIGVVLIPRQWRILGGRFDGRVVNISLPDGLVRGCADCPVFFKRAVQSPADVFAWPSGAYPLRLAFDRYGDDRITRSDSVRFWSAVAEMEADAGMDLFTPIPYLEVADDQSNAVVVWQDRSMRSLSGWGGVGADGHGRIGTAVVALRSFQDIGEPAGSGLVAHELVHALGFGHTCAWRSVVADRSRCPGLSAPGLTAEDVAYLQLAAAVHAAAAEVGAATPWEDAIQAMVPAPRQLDVVVP